MFYQDRQKLTLIKQIEDAILVCSLPCVSRSRCCELIRESEKLVEAMVVDRMGVLRDTGKSVVTLGIHSEKDT